MIDKGGTACNLAALGLTECEARVHAALPAGSLASGHQFGERTGVPRSMVYEALGRLELRGMVLKTGDTRVIVAGRREAQVASSRGPAAATVANPSTWGLIARQSVWMELFAQQGVARLEPEWIDQPDAEASPHHHDLSLPRDGGSPT